MSTLAYKYQVRAYLGLLIYNGKFIFNHEFNLFTN